ncbi:hypothetical protein IFM89_023783 [Coptis chinensis]|uniref:Uncharacterized protein n=1 Tax=Coptis chinensis TaxID=261450 RepID=A0A835HDU8_9MAGN|nr:hypothetical protein IFM89_023783 [Coptis chinensis]
MRLVAISFNVALLSILGKDEIMYREELRSCYCVLEKGYNSMPINLPGTLFNKSMKARQELAQILARILCSRRHRKSHLCRSGYHSKCIDLDPQEEQEFILKKRCGDDKLLNWSDTKKMPITSRVIQETLRVASILSFTFREAVEDVEYHGL